MKRINEICKLGKWEVFRFVRHMQTPDLFDEFNHKELERICARLQCKGYVSQPKWEMCEIIRSRMDEIEAELVYIHKYFFEPRVRDLVKEMIENVNGGN